MPIYDCWYGLAMKRLFTNSLNLAQLKRRIGYAFDFRGPFHVYGINQGRRYKLRSDSDVAAYKGRELFIEFE